MHPRLFLVLTGALAVAACAETLVDHEDGVATIGPEGGTVSSVHGVSLTVPPGALAERVRISIRFEPARSTGALQRVVIRPLGTAFAVPAHLSMRAPQGVAAEQLKIAVETEDFLVGLPEQTYDGSSRSLRAVTHVLSAYVLFTSKEICGNGHDDDGDRLTDCADPACAGTGCPRGCGDGACWSSESCATCPSDCGPCELSPCGNDACDADETCATCPSDCGVCSGSVRCEDPARLSITNIGIFDNASGSYYVTVQGFTDSGPITASGIRLVDGTVVNNHAVVATTGGPFDGYAALPGRPACTVINSASGQCHCDFPVVLSNGQSQCVVSGITHCNMCGQSSPVDHQAEIVCVPG